jgi:hypothetical protein
MKEEDGVGFVKSYAKYYRMKLPGRPDLVGILNDI